MPSINLLPTADRPRERLLALGPGALSDTELVALVFGGDLDCAAAVIARFDGPAGLRQAGLAELCELPRVGVTRACQLLAAVELGRRSQSSRLLGGAPIHGPDDVASRLQDLAWLEQEEMHVLGLDARNRVLVRFVAARGAMNGVHVAPRDVLRRLVREAAASMIIAHNHPSGDPTPSAEDLDLTRRLWDAGQLVGIPLLDHLVIARGGFHSFSERIREFDD